MGAWEPTQLSVAGGLTIGIAFGGIAQATRFCSSGAFVDLVRSADGNRLRARLLAMAVAIRASPRDIAGGVAIGLLITAGWYATGVLAQDEFNPLPPASLTFVAPLGDSLQYLMLFTGVSANFGVALVGGVIFGAFLTALMRGRFHVEGFADQHDFRHQFVGAALMGVGGVLAIGCTVGQGLTGLSTLSLGPAIAAISIGAGGFLSARLVDKPVDAIIEKSALPQRDNANMAPRDATARSGKATVP